MSDQPTPPDLPLLPHTQSEEAWEAQRAAEKYLRFCQAYGSRKLLAIANPLGSSDAYRHYAYEKAEAFAQAVADMPTERTEPFSRKDALALQEAFASGRCAIWNDPVLGRVIVNECKLAPSGKLFLQRREALERMRELLSYAESDVVDFALMQSCHSSLKEIPGSFHFPAKRDPRKPPQWQPAEKRDKPGKRKVNLKAKAKARAERKRSKK